MDPARRDFLLCALLALAAPAAALAHPGPHRHPHRAGRQRRIDRRRRRRTRRRAAWRTIGGRRALVVPVGVAVGWELVVDDQVVVVKEVHDDQIVVVHDDGRREAVAVTKEDNADNAEELEGSEYEVEG